MNTDYQDIKSYKKPNICENLCPNLTCYSLADYLKMGRYAPRKTGCGSLFKANAVKPIAPGVSGDRHSYRNCGSIQWNQNEGWKLGSIA